MISKETGKKVGATFLPVFDFYCLKTYLTICFKMYLRIHQKAAAVVGSSVALAAVVASWERECALPACSPQATSS
jgi:hypothetical protein